jgi:hypothetical protein
MKFNRTISCSIDVFSPVFLVSFGFISSFLLPYVLVKSSFVLPPSSKLFITNESFNMAAIMSIGYYFLWLFGYYFIPRFKFFDFLFTLRIPIKSVSAGNSIANVIFVLLLLASSFASSFLAGVEIEGRSQLTGGINGKLFFLLFSFLNAYSLLFLEFVFTKIRNPFSIKKTLSSFKIPIHVFRIFLLLISFYLVLIPLGGRSRALALLVAFFVFVNYYVKPFRLYQILLLGLSGLAFATYISGDLFASTSIPNLLFSTTPRIFDGIYNLASVVGLFDRGLIENTYFLSTFAEIFKDIGFNTVEYGNSALPSSLLFMSNLLSVPPESVLYSFPISIPGELFLSIGFVGVLLGAPIFGAFAASFYQSFLNARFAGASFSVTIYWIAKSMLPGITGYLASKFVLQVVSLITLFLLVSLFDSFCKPRISS